MIAPRRRGSSALGRAGFRALDRRWRTASSQVTHDADTEPAPCSISGDQCNASDDGAAARARDAAPVLAEHLSDVQNDVGTPDRVVEA